MIRIFRQKVSFMKNFVLVLFLLLFSQNAFPQEFSGKIKTALENREYQTAIGELQALERSDKKLFAINNYDYLLARTAEKQGDFALAMANYQAVANRKSILSEYALYHLAELARSTGNLMLERMYLQQFAASAPDSLLKNAANVRLARSYFESKDFAAAISQLQNLSISTTAQTTTTNSQITVASNTFGKLGGNDAKTRENLAFLGQAFLQTGKANEAREVFTKLVTNLPNNAQPDDYALAGAKGLDELDGGKDNFGKTAPQIPNPEHLRRALIYQFNRSFPLARLHYQAIVEQFPNSPNVPDALYQIGRGYVLENSYNEAIQWFERVQAEFPDHPLAKDALSQTASAYSRVNKPKEAIARYKTFIEKYADADNLDRAYLNIVDVLRDTGEETDALSWAAKTRERFKGKLPEAIALFAQARIHIAQNDWTDVLNDLNELNDFADLGGTRVPGATNKAEITFLRGYTLEKLNRYPEAIDVYLSIPDGRNEYYGWRATERLKALAKNEASSQSILRKLNEIRPTAEQSVMPESAENIRQSAQNALRLTGDETLQKSLLDKVKATYAILPAYQKIPDGKLQTLGRVEILKDKPNVSTNYHQNIADELLFLGLYDEAAPELETALKSSKLQILNPQSNDLAYTLAVFFKRGDMANRAVAYAEPLWRGVPADYQVELIPREQAELLYPAPYVDSLLKYAPPKNVDPRFALSIMRQESRYRADVKSYAAARGLMQFISDTSNKIAAELDRKNFNQDELYHPPTAILFGSQYLGNLFREFPNQPQAVAASYNGGENNMMRWMARAKTDDPDRYVSEILFSQSKDYVYKVMANYRVYQTIYDEKLKGR